MKTVRLNRATFGKVARFKVLENYFKNVLKNIKMINLEEFEVILKDAVKQFNAAHTHAKKVAIVKKDAKNNPLQFMYFAPIEIYMAVQSIKKTPYAKLTNAQKTRFAYFCESTMFFGDLGEDLVYWCMQDFDTARDVIFEKVKFATGATKNYAKLETAYFKNN